MDFWTAFYLVSFLKIAQCLPESFSYTVHLEKRSFENSQKHCFLTNILDRKELEEIQKTIWEQNNRAATSFWVGLKKDKGACVKQNLPLKGFYWTMDNSTQSDSNMWKTEPSDTCTDVRCGLLSVEYGDSGLTSGFVDATCKQQHPFICKRNININMVCPRPQIHGTHDYIVQSNDLYTIKIDCKSGRKYTLRCSHDLGWTVDGNKNLNVSQLCQCMDGYRRDASGHCVDINECVESNPCKHRCNNTEGSYICEEPKLSTPHPKRNEYSPIHPTILPQDVKNDTEVQMEESAGDISNIIVPVIIALLIFIVLVVIIAAIVKGCLRRRTIRRARRKAEAVALNGSSFMEKGNEKEET